MFFDVEIFGISISCFDYDGDRVDANVNDGNLFTNALTSRRNKRKFSRFHKLNNPTKKELEAIVKFYSEKFRKMRNKPKILVVHVSAHGCIRKGGNGDSYIMLTEDLSFFNFDQMMIKLSVRANT
jgi:hypothetical protein